jgi:hypothetical protein
MVAEMAATVAIEAVVDLTTAVVETAEVVTVVETAEVVTVVETAEVVTVVETAEVVVISAVILAAKK